MQDEKGRQRTRVNFNFEQIFNSQNILGLIESLGIAEATFLQAKTLPDIINGKNFLVKGDSLSGKTLMCGLLLALRKENASEDTHFNAIVVVDDNAKERLEEEFSKLNLLEENANFQLKVITFEDAKNCECDGSCKVDLLILDSIEDNIENIEYIKNFIQKAKSSNDKAQIILCAREASNELERNFKDACFLSTSSTSQTRNKEEIDETKHYFCMLGAELTSKPNALCDIIETEGHPATIVFCNQPSDTDMVEAVLNKNGIKTSKLIGNAYYSRVMNALNDLEKGDISAIIVTDIGAKQVNVRNCELVINYSSPASYETYMSRIGQTNEGGYLKKVINFINPLDLGTFHQIRKGLSFEISSMEIPTQEDVYKAKFNNLIHKLNENKNLIDDEKVNFYFDLLNESSEKDDVIKYMIYNSFVKTNDFSQGKKRGDRRERFEQKSSLYAKENNEYTSSNDAKSFEGKFSGRQEEPQLKDVRFYIGLGETHNFSQDNFAEILNEYASEYSDKVKRFSSRKFYSFVDFAEEYASDIEEKLKDALFDGEEICFKKASIINVPKEDDDNSQEEIISLDASDEIIEDEVDEDEIIDEDENISLNN